MKRKLILMTLLTCLFSLASRAEDPLHVSLKSKVRMQNSALSLKDIVDEEGTDIEFIRRYGEVKVSNLDKREQKITQTKLLALLYKSGIEVNKIRFQNTPNVQVERGQDIELPQSLKTRIARALSNHHNIPVADIVMKQARILPDLMDQDYQLMQVKKIHAVDLSRLDQAHFKLYIKNLDGKLLEHDLYLNLKINTTVYTASEAIDEGGTVTAKNLVRGRVVLTSLNGRLASPDQLRPGTTFKTSAPIAQNEILLESMLHEIRLIPQGSAVTLSYRSPMLHVRTQGRLLEASEIGKSVVAENMDSKRTVSGKLVSKDMIEVNHVN